MSRFSSRFGGWVAVRLAPLALIIAATYPGVAAAQEQGTAPQAELQQVLTEIRALNEKLATIHAKAMEDPQLQTDQEALGAEIKAAMESEDPELVRSLERMSDLEAEAASAQQANDTKKLQQLVQEAESIQARFEQVRTKVVEEPAMATKIGDYQERLEKKMIQVDPETPVIIKRFQELEAKLAGALQGGQE